jgi:hypothetical protein
VSSETPENSSISSAGKITISSTRMFATTALAYFALHIPAIWDAVISSSQSSSSPSEAIKVRLSQALAHILASAPCQA